MQSPVRVAVIGGGVVGCSVLYHLTKFGWTDVMLIERSELTSGSTWHAAGGFHTLNADPNMAALQGYTIRLYRELEEITGLSCGLHHVGGLTIAESPDRMDFLKAERAKHRHMGLDTEIIGPDEIARYSPIINTDGLLGALWDPLDGHLDPSGTTHAYARAARMAGAGVTLHNRVLELNQRSDGHWDVVTEKGSVVAEHVVNAAGLWAREVGQMAGVRLPLQPLEHQYLVTGDIAEVYGHATELPHVMDPSGESYLRQEGRGLVIGIYEQACRHWAVEGTSWEFGHELLADDVDRIAASLETAYQRYPVLQTAGIKRIINGPFTFAPDGNPLLGRVPGIPGYWVCCGVMAGFSQAGGVGLALAEWMIEGEPSRDIFAMDVARFGDWTTPAWTRARTRENYQRRFAIAYPNEELPAGRPFHTTPAHGVWKEHRAVFGSAFGMEHVNYFALPGEPLYETPSFRRSNAFAATARECHGVREGVGINEIHNFSKFRITGEGAAAWLDRIMAGRLPREGRLTLSPLLNHRGRLAGDFTIARDGPETFRVHASYAAQDAHMRLFLDLLPEHGVTVTNISRDLVGFQIAGPRARDLLQRTTDADVSGDAMPFRAVRNLTIGMVEATVQRVTYTGDLGYEIYVPPVLQRALFETLEAESAGLGLVPFGMRAMMSLRLEKSFGSWLREYRPDYTAAETGLDRFIAFDKGDFPGRDAAMKEAAQGPRRRLVTFVVDAADADCVADEPVWKDGKVVGFVTSGGYAHYVEKSVALGFVPVDMAETGTDCHIEILGDMRPATIVDAPLFDPSGARMRM